MEAFVYCWTNMDTGQKYVGYHKGSTDDGYVCSSKSKTFWEDYSGGNFSRQIVAQGTEAECVALEKAILMSADLKLDEWYNNSAGGSIVFTEEVRAKMRREFPPEHREKLAAAKRGKKISKEHKAKLDNGRQKRLKERGHWAAGKPAHNRGTKHTEETKARISKGILSTPEDKRKARSSKAGTKSAEQWKDPERKRQHSERMKLWWAERKEKNHR